MATEMLTQTTPDSIIGYGSGGYGGGLDLTDSDRPSIPDWFHSVLEEAVALLGLQEDWDSYGAAPISSEVVVAALGALMHLSTIVHGLSRPEVIPTNRGWISLEWTTSRGEADIEVHSFDRGILYLDVYEKDGTESEEAPYRTLEVVAGALRGLLYGTAH